MATTATDTYDDPDDAPDDAPPQTNIVEALARYRLSVLAVDNQLKREKEDLRFQVPELQWPDSVRLARSAATIGNMSIPERPMLSIATLDEPIQLVLNQEKAAQLSVKVHAENEDAADDTAEILQGMYRAIEIDSRANVARSWAYDRSTKCGTGVYRIDKAHDPEGGHELDQKLVFKRLLYQSAAVFDPFAQEPDWSDGEFAFVTADLRWSTYKRKYKNKGTLWNCDDGELTALMAEKPGWIGGDSEESRTVRIAEYWRVEITTRKKVLLDDHSMAFEDKIPTGRTAMTGKNAKSIEVEQRRVFWSVINCQEEIEPAQEWDGQYIPLFRTIGRELQPFDGERRMVGMIANAKDGARLTNYGASNVVEMAALEPKVPFQGVEGVFEGHEKEYEAANLRNIPYLQYKATGLDGKPAGPPERVKVDVSRLGPSMELLRMGRDFVQMATGTFDPALGKQPTAHRSGRAIVALQDQTVAGTSHFLDNLAEITMTYEAKVVLDLIRKVYDRPGRIARLLDTSAAETKTRTVMLNQPHTIDPKTKRPIAVPLPPGTNPADLAADPANPVKHYDLKKGRYGVTVSIGKSSGARLQQGADEMSDILQADPALMPVVGPEYFKFRDFPGAKEIAKLLLKMRNHAMPWLRDDATAPDAASELAHAKATMQQMDAAIKQMQQTIDAKEIEQRGKLAIVQAQEASENQRAALDREVKIAVAEIAAQAKHALQDMQLFYEERARVGAQDHAADQAAHDRAHQVASAAAASADTAALSGQQHDQALEAGDLAHQQTVVQAEQGAAHSAEATAAQPAAAAPDDPNAAPPATEGQP